MAEEQVREALHNCTYDIMVVENSQAIAMGRMIGDGLHHYEITIWNR